MKKQKMILLVICAVSISVLFFTACTNNAKETEEDLSNSISDVQNAEDSNLPFEKSMDDTDVNDQSAAASKSKASDKNTSSSSDSENQNTEARNDENRTIKHTTTEKETSQARTKTHTIRTTAAVSENSDTGYAENELPFAPVK